MIPPLKLNHPSPRSQPRTWLISFTSHLVHPTRVCSHLSWPWAIHLAGSPAPDRTWMPSARPDSGFSALTAIVPGSQWWAGGLGFKWQDCMRVGLGTGPFPPTSDLTKLKGFWMPWAQFFLHYAMNSHSEFLLRSWTLGLSLIWILNTCGINEKPSLWTAWVLKSDWTETFKIQSVFPTGPARHLRTIG